MKVLDAGERIICFKTSKYEDSLDLVLYATETTINVVRIIEDGKQFEILHRYHVGSRVTCLDWSSETKSILVGQVYETRLVFCAGFQDKSIIFYRGQKQEELTLDVNKRLMGYISDIAIDPCEGIWTVSCGEDKMLRFWASGQEPWEYPLESNAVSVKWNPRLASHLLVGQESGSVQILDVANQQTMFTVYCPSPSLRSIDWNLSNPNIFGAVVDTNYCLWNMSRKPIHIPEHEGSCHLEGAFDIQWSPTDQNVFATVTKAPLKQMETIAVKVYPNIITRVPRTYLVPENGRIVGFGWHHSFIIVAINNKLLILE
ncbi:WD40-repeat-containing domain protein [Gorgonomyces haynaldii]|nr:WD40-repeat-containing domain protein [Gorgonomyces haynaldii]